MNAIFYVISMLLHYFVFLVMYGLGAVAAIVGIYYLVLKPMWYLLRLAYFLIHAIIHLRLNY